MSRADTLAGSSQQAMDRLAWQDTLFASRPTRRALSALTPSWEARALTCRVHRNHNFELLAAVMSPFLAFAGLDVTYGYSAYDDALNFQLEGEADLDLIWLDLERYSEASSLSEWLADRLSALGQETGKPVLLVTMGDELDLPSLPGVYAITLNDIGAELGDDFLDMRASAMTGTRLSNAALIAIARRLGGQWLPAIFRPALKAVVLDLDQTLYQGVLGEDGADGVTLTEGHAALQRHLKILKESGTFLALASRNEHDDVKRLFERRTDFPLRWDDFSHHGIGWQSKGQTMAEIAEALRIGTDAMLFVDDNPGELLAVAEATPGIGMLHARPAAEDTLRALQHFPGLFKWRDSADDALRLADLAANAQRLAQRSTARSQDDYFRSLGVTLEFTLDDPATLARAAELSAKTNQFNLSLLRADERRVDAHMHDADKAVVTVALSDRLSDSGTIAMLLGQRDGATLAVSDVCISCRALGRQIEDILVITACRVMAEALGTQEVRFESAAGPRNAPALDWLNRCTNGTGHLADLPKMPTNGVTMIEPKMAGTDRKRASA